MANEKRLIDANAAADAIAEAMDKYDGYDSCQSKIIQGLMKAQEIVADAPTVDAEEVVRCKECVRAAVKETHVFCGFLGVSCGKDNYCSFGERKF